MNLNDEMLEMMKFYEFYKQMKAYEKNNEFTEKTQENFIKTEGANNISKKIAQKTEGAILNDKKSYKNDEKRQKNFGNARTIRNLLDKMIDKHATNMMDGILTPDKKYILTEYDMPEIDSHKHI